MKFGPPLTSDVYGDNVIDIEYVDDADRASQDEGDVVAPASETAAAAFAEVCADPARIPMTILRDRDPVTPESPAYVYESCRHSCLTFVAL